MPGVHPLVGAQVDGAHDLGRKRPGREVAHQGEHEPVVVRVDAQVEEVVAADRREVVEPSPVTSFRHVDHALEHRSIVACGATRA